MAEVPVGGATRGWPGRVAVAILRGEPPQVFLAETDAVLGRLLALRLVARADPGALEPDTVRELREALTGERWADALLAWMTATGEVVDAYPDEEVVTEATLDAERASMEIRLAPIFQEAAPAGGGPGAAEVPAGGQGAGR
jgi:hypothetical protein